MSHAAASRDKTSALSDMDEGAAPDGVTTGSGAVPPSAAGIAPIAGQNPSDFDDAAWQAPLRLIQRAASTARAMHQQAHMIAREAHQSVQRSIEAARLAEERARQAEAEAEAALARGAQAEAMLSALQAKLQATEKRLHQAEMQGGLAQERFKLLCARIEDEFETLTVASPLSYDAKCDPTATGFPAIASVRMMRPVIPIVSSGPDRQGSARIR